MNQVSKKINKKRKVVVKTNLKPAWMDVDDEIEDSEGLKSRKIKSESKTGSKYKSRLVENFELVYGSTPNWARIDIAGQKKRSIDQDTDSEDDDEDEEGEFGQISKRKHVLASGKLKIRKMTDLNISSLVDKKTIIRSVKFHPRDPIGLVANSSGNVSFHIVDGDKNQLMDSVEFENFPMRNISFTSDGKEVLVSSGLMSHFYSFDMLSRQITKVRPNKFTEKETVRNIVTSPDENYFVTLGHHGNIYLFSRKSKEIVATMKANEEVSHVSFNSDGTKMYSCGGSGEIKIWDINSRACTHSFQDEGTLFSTRIDTSSDFLCTGSKSGIVNIHDLNGLTGTGAKKSGTIKPIKSVMNLVTSVTSLEFNPKGEILAMASNEMDNAFRFVHFPSFTVFPDFPAVNYNFGRINSLAFSPNGGYFSFGNNKGVAQLYRVLHYDNY